MQSPLQPLARPMIRSMTERAMNAFRQGVVRRQQPVRGGGGDHGHGHGDAHGHGFPDPASNLPFDATNGPTTSLKITIFGGLIGAASIPVLGFLWTKTKGA